jgi:hypothetical protein
MCLVHVPSYAYGETTINGSGVVHIQNQILHVLAFSLVKVYFK